MMSEETIQILNVVGILGITFIGLLCQLCWYVKEK